MFTDFSVKLRTNGATIKEIQSGMKLNENTEGSIERRRSSIWCRKRTVLGRLAEFEGLDREVRSNLLCQLER